MKKQPEITEATRKNICDTFWQLYKEKPLERITVGALTEKAGIHRSTFYRYFHDVYEIHESMMEEELFHYQTYLMSMVTAGSSVDLRTFIDEATKYLATRGEQFYYLFGKNCSPDVKNTLVERMAPLFYTLTGREQNAPESEYYLRILFEVLITNLCFWYEHREQFTLQDIARMSYPILAAFY